MSLFSWLTGTDLDAEQARGDAADARLRQINEEALARGRYTQELFQQAERNRQTGLTGDVNQQVEDDFIAGAKEGLSNVLAPIGDALKTISKIVPLWVWLAVALGAFGWFGGFRMFKK